MSSLNNEQFIDLLKQISALKNHFFSGIGLVFYHDIKILSKFHCNLVNHDYRVPSATLRNDEMISYLLHISSFQHPYHDGFHFINSEGKLTHVAQFFSPPIDPLINNIAGQGARTFCSQCGSKIPGVKMVGTVSSTGNIYLFENGKLLNVQCKKSYFYDESCENLRISNPYARAYND